MVSRSFERFAGACAIAAAIGGLGYAITFFVFVYNGSTAAGKTSTVLLLLGGLLVTAVFVALYARLRTTDEPFALLALVLGIVSGAGTAIHGAYDVANFVKPPAQRLASDLPNAVDPRGFLTFGVAALALAVVAWLILRGGAFSRGLAYVGFVAAALLMILYLGRMIAFDPKHPVLVFAAIASGFVVNPLWFLWIGRELWRGPEQATTAG